MLEIKNLNLKKEGRQILKDVNIKMKSKVFSIVGANGAGKTSLSHCIMGIEKCPGSILLDGEEINDLKIYERAKKGVTLAWQIPANFEGLTVKDYLVASCRCLNINDDEKLNLIRERLESIGLNEDYLKRKLSKLSGGERKRIELTSASLTKPKLIILDEPDSGIDMLSFRMIGDFIRMISKDSQVMVITHNRKIARIAEESALLKGGVVVEQGPTCDILKKFNSGGEINE